MEANLPARYVDGLGRFTLVINVPSASWAMASTIAKLVNEQADTGEVVAVAVDPRNVVVQVPASERARPDTFIADVLGLTVPPVAAEARVIVDDRSGSIVGDRDAELDPFVVSQHGLTITTMTTQPPRGQRGLAPVAAVNGRTKLQDLLDAFNQLKVPADDRITIIEQLHADGKLHAKLMVDGEEK